MTGHDDVTPEATPARLTGAELRERSLELLEFPRVREALASFTRLPMSHERALALGPVFDPEVLGQLQQETEEADLLVDEAVPSMGADPRPVLQRASMQAVLSGDELMRVADAIDLVRQAKALGSRRRDTPLIHQLTRNIADLRPLERELRAKLTPSGELKDDASPLLRELRRESRQSYQRATRALEQIASSDMGADVLQDHMFTVRAERLVLPVKADFRGRLPGIVHGVSDSGATLFIEPLSNVGLTNAWREANAAETEETLRILRALSASVSKRAGDLSYALEITARLDMALAKARYARSYQGIPIRRGQGFAAEHATPDTRHIHLDQARHPLLHAHAVPVSLTINHPAVGLVITGPNTGGKTVALKTLGLMVLMRQSGLRLPCGEETRLPLVDGVYADIGDQQSIDAAVSTFSSHVTTIAGILTNATEHSLVLLDELGTSTDPEEGSALARAIIGHLASRGVPTVATTHHRSLAALAEETPELENASVELDPVTLLPTYRLTMGLPGRSYAMAVAERIGLDPAVVERAKGFLDPEHRQTEALLATIQEEQHRTRQRLQEAEDAERRAAELAHDLERRLEELAQAQASVVEEVRKELQAEARKIQAQLKQAESVASWQAFRGEPPPPRALDEARGEVADVQRMLRSRVWGKAAQQTPRKRKISVGDAVEVGALGFTGTVLSEPDEQEKVEVLVGSARVRLDASRLRKVGDAPEPAESTTSINLRPDRRHATAEPELDLRGLRLHEALERLDDFLDSALAQGLASARIIHGKGTGALRSGVWRHLAGHRAVESYDYAPRQRGGDGATEVALAG